MNERYIEEAVMDESIWQRFALCRLVVQPQGTPVFVGSCCDLLEPIPVLGGESYLGTRCGLPPLHELIGAIVIRRQGAVNSKNRF